MNLGVRREGTVSDDILETKRLTRTDGRDPASICLVARRGGYIANKKMGIWLALFFSVLATVVHAEPTMAEGLFMFMGGESGKSCADEGNRFICNRGHIGSWERNTFAYPTREQMNQVSGLKPNMVSIKGGQRGTYCYTQNLDMKCGSGSPNTLAHWFTVGGADPVKADWTGGGFGSADKKFDYFISLKSNEAGGAFCNDARGSSTIKCDKPTAGKGETFHMLWLSTEESKSADEKAAAEKIAINSAPAPPPCNASSVQPPRHVDILVGSVGNCTGMLEHGSTCTIMCNVAEGYYVTGPATCNNGTFIDGVKCLCTKGHPRPWHGTLACQKRMRGIQVPGTFHDEL